MDDVLTNKAATVERCLGRVREDAVVPNLQRAAQACIDGTMHVVRATCLGLPRTSRDAFQMLADAGDLGTALAASMMRTLGFRNVAVHEYWALNVDVGQAVGTDGLGDLAQFARWMIGRAAA